jgi:hypothetical protein
MTETENGSSFFEGVEHLAEGALDYGAKAMEAGNKAFEGAAEGIVGAEGAEGLLNGEARAIPGVGEVVAAAGIVYHGGSAAYDLATGDYDGASNNLVHTAEDTASAATGGVVGMIEGGVDLLNAGLGGGEDTSAHGLIMHSVDAMGEGVANLAYEYEYGEEPPPAE